MPVTARIVYGKNGRRDETTPEMRAMAKAIAKTKATERPIAPPNTRRTRAKWPLVSENGGVMPGQADEANANLKRAGIHDSYYQKDGSVVWGSHEARKKHLKFAGLLDRSGYY